MAHTPASTYSGRYIHLTPHYVGGSTMRTYIYLIYFHPSDCDTCKPYSIGAFESHSAALFHRELRLDPRYKTEGSITIEAVPIGDTFEW